MKERGEDARIYSRGKKKGDARHERVSGGNENKQEVLGNGKEPKRWEDIPGGGGERNWWKEMTNEKRRAR